MPERPDFPHGPPHAIYAAWRRRRFEIVTATVQLDELRRASRYPKFRSILQPHRVARLLNELQGASVLRHLSGHYDTADPFDARLLALAATARADYLVTGDKRSGLLARRSVGSARILTATAFCDIIR